MSSQRNEKSGDVGWLLQLAGKRKVSLLLACLLSIVSAVLSFAPYVCVYFILSVMLDNVGNLAQLSFGSVEAYVWIALGSVVLGLLCTFLSSILSHGAAYKILFELRMKFAQHVSELPMGFHTSNSTGKLRKIVDENVEKIELFIAHQLPDAVGSLASPIVMLVVLFLFDWRMGLACLIPLVLGFAAQASSLSNPQSKAFMESFQDLQDKMNGSAVEYVRGISVVKAFNQTVFSFRRFHDTIQAYKDSAILYTHSVKNSYCAFLVLLNSVFLFLLPVGILIGSQTSDYQAFAASFLFYLIFSMGIAGPVSKLMYVFVQGFMVSSSIRRVRDVFDTPVLDVRAMGEEPRGNAIAFDEVCFSYGEEGEGGTLHDISFTAEPGEVTALVGPSGSGKSTIAQLIPRFWDIDDGSVSIGGVDVRSWDPDDLMRSVSFVFQDVFLFKKSILENIKLGNEHATDEEVIEAAKAARCHDFIERLPHGYHSVLGSKGTYLSAGERQRIVIARAIVKDAPIVILDEATAFADPENEHMIQRALEKLMKGKTVVVIAHRLSTIRHADKIVVVEAGRVVEQGTHAKLVQGDTRYQHLWDVYRKALTWRLA